jgi:hypothetical protein
MFRWDKHTFNGEIRVMRPISEGEEITVCYFQEILEPAAVTHEGQKYLLEGYTSNARVRSVRDLRKLVLEGRSYPSP